MRIVNVEYFTRKFTSSYPSAGWTQRGPNWFGYLSPKKTSLTGELSLTEQLLFVQRSSSGPKRLELDLGCLIFTPEQTSYINPIRKCQSPDAPEWSKFVTKLNLNLSIVIESSSSLEARRSCVPICPPLSIVHSYQRPRVGRASDL